MQRKTTASVEASTTVSLAYASEYGFGRTYSSGAANRYFGIVACKAGGPGYEDANPASRPRGRCPLPNDLARPDALSWSWAIFNGRCARVRFVYVR